MHEKIFAFHCAEVMNKKDILKLIESDEWMMHVLRTARELQLPDWMIGAGFVRNKVWDHLHGYQERTLLGDVDLIYFDPSDIQEDTEKKYEQLLIQRLDVPWSVKNQARMHVLNGDAPYTSSEDAMCYWPETATAVAVKVRSNDQLELIAPYGVTDLANLEVRLSPQFSRQVRIYNERIQKKQWHIKWPKLKIFYDNAKF